MEGSFQADTYNITALLGRASFPKYSAKAVIVPAFQRGFSWEKSHVSTFWEDVITFHSQLDSQDAQRHYFFGPIVIMPEDNYISLLDGQQRLATVTILLSVIRDLARPIGDRGSDLARDTHRDLIIVDEDEDVYALTLSELDEGFFRKTIQEQPVTKDTPRIRSQRLIRNARRDLQRNVKKELEKKSVPEQIEFLKSLKRTIESHLKFVAIEVKSEEEAFLIFETLNDRGLRLAVPDLVLNYLMRVADNRQQRKQIRQNWNKTLTNLGQRKVSTFVRHMWVSRFGDVKSQGLYREIREKLSKEPELSPLGFSRLCANESEKYSALVNVNTEIIGTQSEEYITALMKRLSADRSLPLLLSGIVCLDNSDFAKLARAITTLVVRHSVIANLNPSDLEDTLFKAARIIREESENGNSSRQTLSKAKAELQKLNPVREQITAGIEELYLKSSEANYIIFAIAKNIQSVSKSMDLTANTIEHIFPENAKKEDWPSQQELEPYVWHIGNLSVLEPTLNRDAGNKPFADKKQYYEKSEIEMMRIVNQDYDDWNAEAIIKRAKSLLPRIRDI